MRYFTLASFISYIPTIQLMTASATHAGLEKAAKIVQAEAKAEIGTYQGAAGPFGAWPPLAQTTISGWHGHPGNTNDTPLLRAGDLRDSIEYNVAGHTATVGSASPVALYQEMGTRTIPPRSFLGGAAVRKENEINHEITMHFAMALAGTPIP